MEIKRKVRDASSNDSIEYIYNFDQYIRFEDVKEIIKKLQNSGINIDEIIVRELADYEDGPLSMIYNVNNFDECEQDFAYRDIQNYYIKGNHNMQSINVKISPNSKSVSFKAYIQLHQELQKMIDELEKGYDKSNMKYLDSDSFLK